MTAAQGNGGSPSSRPTLALLHTVLSLPPVRCARRGADARAELFHIVDETLLSVTRKAGSLTAVTRRRVLGYLESAAEAGADSCS